MVENKHKKRVNLEIHKFLTQISEKNYAEANKYLRSALQHKMMSRVKDSAENLGFKNNG